MERVKKSNGSELMYVLFLSHDIIRIFQEYMNQQKKIIEASSVIGNVIKDREDSYHKVKNEL